MAALVRREQLQALSQDHHNALVIALRCRRVADGRMEVDGEEFRATVLEFFQLQIAPHFDVEERFVLPALRALGEREMAERIAGEHDRLRAMIDGRMVTDSDLRAFGQLLDDHIRYEERVVFEETQHRISDDVLAEILRASLEVPQICPTTFKKLPR
jgi:hypothetical protein